MRRGAKPAKSKLRDKPPIAHKSTKSEGSRVHDLEKRLAEALGHSPLGMIQFALRPTQQSALAMP